MPTPTDINQKKKIFKFVFIAYLSFLAFIILKDSFFAERSSFENIEQLKTYQQKKGFDWIGQFGDNFPAHIVETAQQDDSIEFRLQNGQVHSYNGYETKTLKMIRLLSDNQQETVVVFIKENKRRDEI